MARIDGKSKNGDSRVKSQIPLPNTSQYLWRLNEFELKVAYAILEKNHKTTWEQVAKKLGISRRQLYNLRQSQAIQEPIRKYSRDMLITELPDVYKALVKKAKSGDTASMKLFFEIVGGIDEQKVVESRKTNSFQEIMDRIRPKDLAENKNKPFDNKVPEADEKVTRAES